MKEQPWKSADATVEIRKIGKADKLTVSYSRHAKEQMLQRDLSIGDAMDVLENGFVYAQAVAATQAGLYKYSIEASTPNSGSRRVRLVVIPDEHHCWIKIVTVMWVDE